MEIFLQLTWKYQDNVENVFEVSRVFSVDELRKNFIL